MKKTVSVITRTKNRKVLLRRALDSVKSQSFKDFSWIIVNDGGTAAEVNEVYNLATNNGIDAKLIHLENSVGMEAASNIAISSSESEYIVIHDDDDSWDPEFLQTTVGYLKSNKQYKGVITLSNIISETIENDKIIFKKKKLFVQRIYPIKISDLAKANFFPPISFLFSRDTLKEIGGFDESLQVRGDWDFNLRFIEKFDIGVIHEALANWHHRISTSGYQGNTVINSKSLHQEYDAKIRNKYLRRDLDNGRFGLGFLLNLSSINYFPKRYSLLQKLKSFFKKKLLD